MMSPEDSWVSKWQRVSECLSLLIWIYNLAYFPLTNVQVAAIAFLTTPAGPGGLDKSQVGLWSPGWCPAVEQVSFKDTVIYSPWEKCFLAPF